MAARAASSMRAAPIGASCARSRKRSQIPVIVNGDIVDLAGVRRALAESGADGVMIGRGAYGRPWFLRQVIHSCAPARSLPDPSMAEQSAIVRRALRCHAEPLRQ